MTFYSYGNRWQCPYCQTHTVLSSDNINSSTVALNPKSVRTNVALRIQSIACSNEDCGELTVDYHFGPFSSAGGRSTLRSEHVELEGQILPLAKTMALPSYIPEEIAITYREAVLISDLSGRASAAMARRCLQGIVRDYFDIPSNKRGNLGAELSFVRDKIDVDLWDAIQAVRGVGDIGAHMDNNVSEIIEITPKEAKLLLALIETLFKEWYIARAKKTETTSALIALLGDKREVQRNAKRSSKLDADGGAPPAEVEE